MIHVFTGYIKEYMEKGVDMNKLMKLVPYIDIGGIHLILLKLADLFLHTHKALPYQQKVFENADAKDYPRLIKDLYKIRTGKVLDLDNPETFNEKIQWLKIYDLSPLKTRLADKYLVREWIKEKIGEEYLVPILGVWDSFDEIDFDSLPNSFFLKCNHGYSFNYAVKDKSTLDIEEAGRSFNKWMDCNFAFSSLELQYRNIPRKIIAEKYIEQNDGTLYDYKFHVFNGEPKIVEVITDRDLISHKARQCFMSIDWTPRNLLDYSYEEYDIIPPRPVNLNKMIEIAAVLGKGFKYVRVDLYNLDGVIKFGEMTFTPTSGYAEGDEREQYEVGSWIDIS